MDQRDEIKARLSIVDLVSEYVELKRAGRNFKGLCPFHSEKSPSFVVSPDKELAHCFGCNKGGDIFGFYQEVEGVDFVQAMKDLAQKVGVEIKEVNKVEVAKSKDKKEKLIELHELASVTFQENMANTPEGAKVLAYVQKRGISDEMIKKYRIGFAKESFDALYKTFLAKGFSKEEIVESGLATAKDTNLSQIFDRFRLRLMFPIFSKEGKVIAFGGRALKADESAKYLNSPETPIYHKSDVLYGYNFARESIRQTETVILVEGYFDQIAMYQAGFHNVVAVSGTALTPRHLQLLKKTAKNILFCLDGDSAGREALYRSAELALVEGFNLKVIDLGDYKDPGELLQSEPEKFGNLVENAVDFFDRVLALEFYSIPELNRTELSVITKFLEKVLPLVKKISSSILQDVVARKIAGAIGVKVEVIYEELKKVQQTKILNSEAKNSVVPVKSASFTTEEHFWGYIFWFPEVILSLAEKLEKYEFLFSEKDVYKVLMDYYNDGRNLIDFRLIDTDLEEKIKHKYSIVAVYLESVSSVDWNPELVAQELERLLDRLVKEYKKNEGSKLESQIRLAEQSKDTEKLKLLLDQYRQILSL